MMKLTKNPYLALSLFLMHVTFNERLKIMQWTVKDSHMEILTAVCTVLCHLAPYQASHRCNDILLAS